MADKMATTWIHERKIPVLVILCVLLGPGNPCQATDSSAVEIVKEAIAAFQKPNYEHWATYYADDAVIVDLGSGKEGTRLQGKEEILAWFKIVAESWADSTYTPLRIIAQGDSVLWEWRWEGTQTRDFVDALGSGRKVDFRGMTIWDIENGKIRHEVTLYNYATLLHQIDPQK